MLKTLCWISIAGVVSSLTLANEGLAGGHGGHHGQGGKSVEGKTRTVSPKIAKIPKSSKKAKAASPDKSFYRPAPPAGSFGGPRAAPPSTPSDDGGRTDDPIGGMPGNKSGPVEKQP